MVDLESVVGYPEKVEKWSGEAAVYVLGLFDGRYYVGVSEQPKRRVISHIRGESVSPSWVKTYPPVAIESVIGFERRGKAMEREREVTLALSRHYGPQNVRGAEWTGMAESPPGGFS